MSISTAGELYKASELFSFIGPDDAIIGGILPKYLDIHLETNAGFDFLNGGRASPCGFRMNSAVDVHGYSDNEDDDVPNHC